MSTMQITAIGILGAALITLAIVYFKQKKLDQIRADVYKLFLFVEHKYLKSGAGEEKLNEVVEAAYMMLPMWLRFFVTKTVLRDIIDEWFRTIKDLLDDGRANNSIENNGV